MFQSVGHEVIDAFGECMNVPLFRRTIVGSSKCTTLEYTSAPDTADEVEDLFQLLSSVLVLLRRLRSLRSCTLYVFMMQRFPLRQQKHPEIQAVSCGAILSSYQRIRVENVYGAKFVININDRSCAD